MRQATVRSRCECEAKLVATLNEEHLVLNAYVMDGGGNIETAPANVMGSTHERFDIGWLCGVCGRNTMRSFSADSLVWIEAPQAPAA